MANELKIPELDKRGLREFGLVTGGVGAALFGLFFPWLLERPWPLWPWVLFGSLAAVGLVTPMLLGPVYRGWMRFGHLASRITTPLIMGLIFYGVFWPLGVVMRLKGRDTMKRSYDKESASYRVTSETKKPDMLNPF
jgi:hypothetical protein